MNSMKRTRIYSELLCLLLCFSLLFSLAGCGSSAMEQKQIFAMDTVMTLTAYGKHAAAGLNAAAGTISAMDAQLDPEIPTNEELSAAIVKKAFDKMVLTSYPATGSYSVSFPAGTQISFGAIGKGCAAETAIDAMRQAGVSSGIISLGGNVQTLGLKPDGSNWTVAVQDPNDTSTWVGTVSVGETAVVTSGSYQRFFENDGNIYHHIINPMTAAPVTNNLLSATIICEDGTLADALSTAMFVLGETRALNYWRAYGGFEMILITKSNQIICTKGLIESYTPNSTADTYRVRFAE